MDPQAPTFARFSSGFCGTSRHPLGTWVSLRDHNAQRQSLGVAQLDLSHATVAAESVILRAARFCIMAPRHRSFPRSQSLLEVSSHSWFLKGGSLGAHSAPAERVWHGLFLSSSGCQASHWEAAPALACHKPRIGLAASFLGSAHRHGATHATCGREATASAQGLGAGCFACDMQTASSAKEQLYSLPATL